MLGETYVDKEKLFAHGKTVLLWRCVTGFMIPVSVSRLTFRFSLLCRLSSLCNGAALSEGVNKLYGARQRQVSDGSRNESGELEIVEIVRRLLYKCYKMQNTCIDILCVRRFYLRIESMQRINIQTNVRRISWTLSRKAHTQSHKE